MNIKFEISLDQSFALYSATSSEAFDDRHVQFIEQPQDRSSSSDKKNRSFLFYQFSAGFAYYKMNTKRKKGRRIIQQPSCGCLKKALHQDGTL